MPIDAIFAFEGIDMTGGAAGASLLDTAPAAFEGIDMTGGAAGLDPTTGLPPPPDITPAYTPPPINPAANAQQIATRSLAGITQAPMAAPAGTAPMPPQVNAAAQMAQNTPVSDNVFRPITEGMPSGDFYESGSGAGPMDMQTQMAHANLDAANAPSGLSNWWSNQSPFQKGMYAFTAATGAARLGLFNQGITGVPSSFQPYSGSLSKYSMSPNFRPSVANPSQFQYTPRYMAEGGLASVPGYAAGGQFSDPMYYYDMMTRQPQSASEGKNAPSIGFDTGIYHDTDPDTQRLDALTAAQIRQAKLNTRTNMQGQGTVRPNPMGQLNLTPPGVTAAQTPQYQDITAAKGGIMQASDLGGYAAGGNPRLLKGPGDGMSDNIPAMIGQRQPARLADGEFVVPADVVSHLGNGSTEAGAKKLDHMMGKVRKARTGNPKQGKQIDPDKYLPE